MFKNSSRAAFRKLLQYPVLSILKIGGLSISICAVVLMVLYINFQWQYDRFHENGSNIYRLQTDQYKDGELTTSSAMTYAGAGPLMKSRLSGVKNQLRVGKWIGNDVVIQYQHEAARERYFYFVEPSFLEVFSFELIRGNPATALAEPNSVVLTEKVASTLFGEVDPMGRQVTMESRKSLKVTGIIEDPPLQSHLDFEILVSYSTLEAFGFDDEGVYGANHFDSFYTYTYVLLDPSVDPEIMAQQLTKLVRDRKQNAGIKDEFHLQPLQEIHLYSNLQYELQATGNGKNIWVLWAISMLVLALACANYFNISTATALDQSKAIGVRKVIGASRRQIIAQLCIENFMYTILGLIIGVLSALMLIPVVEFLFNIQLSGILIQKDSFFNPISVTIGLIILGTISSSLLPSIVISSFPPVHIFNRSFNIGGLGLNVRKSLVITQFAIIICLLAGSIAIHKQTQYIQNQHPGLDFSNIMVVKGPLGTSLYENLNPAHDRFRNELNSISTVADVAMSRQVPGNEFEIVHGVRLESASNDLTVSRIVVTPAYFQVYGLRFLAGKEPTESTSKNGAIVVNEAAMKLMGFQDPAQLLGKKLSFWEKDKLIVGVIRDYHHLSLHHPVIPSIFDMAVGEGLEDGYFSIKMTQRNYQNNVARIQQAYESAFPDTVFEYFDMEEHYHTQYAADNNFKTLNFAFTGLAFFIACIGLFGLSMIMVKKRFKEVAIRKVLGSSVKEIVTLLSMQFIRMILLGWLIAIPITWYALETWLQNFPFRIPIPWWIFLVALVVAIGITLFITSINSIKAAMSNPLKYLSRE
ncbi:MAG: ABC transporter permease [Cyclobacteriaceae bacterium]|nr:MAG: ABC transporter permease [Cyclobacteriaceae bacterium]